METLFWIFTFFILSAFLTAVIINVPANQPTIQEESRIIKINLIKNNLKKLLCIKLTGMNYNCLFAMNNSTMTY